MGRDKLVPPNRTPRIHCPKSVGAFAAIVDLAKAMKTSPFRAVALPTAVAEAARKAAAEGKPDHRIVVVDAPNSNPCRHCLRWAKPGETVILFPYQAIPSGRPYSECGPIFVHSNRCVRYDQPGYPPAFREGRVFRAYNSGCDIIDAVLPDGERPEAVIEKLFENPDTAFVHARSATRGCYTFQVERI